MPLQDWIHRFEEGGGAKFLKRLAALLAFVVAAAVFDSIFCRDGYNHQGFATADAMESADVARNLARGRGFVTDSIRPVALYMLDRTAPDAARKALSDGTPDLSQPPVYPAALAAVMKLLRVDFATKPGQVWYYAPEAWIAVFNQALYFVAVTLLFGIARRLFDLRVAWLASILFAGTALFWRFTISGLSTILLEVVFLALVRVMLGLEERGRATEPKSVAGWALAVGALAGLGTMTRYSFGWVMLPALGFCAVAAPRARRQAVILAVVAFLVVCAPWVARTRALSGSAFGTSIYALVQETPPFEGQDLERSLNPEGGFHQVRLAFLREKWASNLQSIVGAELPTLGGTWLTAFFAVGLLIPFRNRTLGRLRMFILGAIIIWALAEAVGRTSASTESPVVNSENLLVILAPLVMAYAAGLFYVLLDQLNVESTDARAAMVGLFAAVMCLPVILLALAPPPIPENYPYAPRHIQLTARMMTEKELTMSDIPWAVAWYGQRPCLWLTLDDSGEFQRVNALKPISTIFLTQRTTDSRLLTQLSGPTNSWGRFFWDCWSHGEVPTGFPLQKAPTEFLPDQMLLSDRVRW